MKKLFLSSFACKTLDKILDLLSDRPENLNVAFIVTAADPYDDKEFVNVDRDKLIDLGFKVTDVDIKNKTEAELMSILSSMDVIAVAGGNTYYLLYHAKKSGFTNVVKKLIDKGVLYVGSSAGAILACPTIDAARLFDSQSFVPELKDFEGMGLVNFIVIPHFDKTRYQERMRKTIEEWSGKGFHLYPLTDEQAVIVKDENISFVDLTPTNQ